jgi:GntR family transcriptional repressor for pyruvate dehydrogenase complex
MERMGLVSRVAEELERLISQGLLPEGGLLPSEQTLARRYGVSRPTVREALLRLAVRGLVVQHPGRRSRAVAMDEAVTLENLGVALRGEGPAHPERRRLLEGYLAL